MITKFEILKKGIFLIGMALMCTYCGTEDQRGEEGALSSGSTQPVSSAPQPSGSVLSFKNPSAIAITSGGPSAPQTPTLGGTVIATPRTPTSQPWQGAINTPGGGIAQTPSSGTTTPGPISGGTTSGTTQCSNKTLNPEYFEFYYRGLNDSSPLRPDEDRYAAIQEVFSVAFTCAQYVECLPPTHWSYPQKVKILAYKNNLDWAYISSRLATKALKINESYPKSRYDAR